MTRLLLTLRQVRAEDEVVPEQPAGPRETYRLHAAHGITVE
jgi:hypothetical protein